MDSAVVVTAFGVLLIWGVVGLTISRWGPGISSRFVRCPEKKQVAALSVLHGEADFGSVEARDVVACSLFPGEAVACDKRCLARL